MTDLGLPERLGAVLNSAVVSYAVSMAKDTGILQALMDAEQPLTPQEIADDKSLKERYVKEILASLGTAELLHMTTNGNGEICYHLEVADKKALKTSLYAFISFANLFGSLYEKVKDCIKTEGPNGLSYSDSVQDVIDEMNTYNLDNYTTTILTRTDNLREKLETGCQVIEFGSGRGRLLAKLASMFPKSSFTTSEYRVDLMEQQRVRWGHIPNIAFKLYDLCALPDVPTEQYDWIFCVDVIHDLPKPLEALQGIRRLLAKGTGVFSFIDLSTSGNPITDKGNMTVACYYSAGSFMCTPESYQQPDSAALGPCWGRQKAIDLLTTAGFADVKEYDIEHFQTLFVCKL